MTIWAINFSLLLFILGFLLAERLAGGLQVVVQFASEPGAVQVGLQVRAGGPSIIHNPGAA